MPKRFRSLRRLLVTLALGLGALLLLYVVGVNAFLASAWGQRLINSQPEVVEIHYEQARSRWPFLVEIEGLTLRVQDSEVQLSLTAERATMQIALLQLLRLRFRADAASAEGVTFWLRQRLDKADADPARLKKLPPIPGFASALRAPHSSNDPDALVTLDLRNLDVKDLREVWIDEYRFSGRLDVQGGFYYEPLRALQLYPTSLQLSAGGTLRLGDGTLANFDASTLAVATGRIALQDFEQKSLASLELSAAIGAHVINAQLLNYYLKDIPGVRLEQGGGDLSLRLDVSHGVIGRDSKLVLDTKKLALQLPFFAVIGHGAIRWELRRDKAWLDVTVRDVDVVERATGLSRLHGDQFKLSAQASGVDLAQPIQLDLVLDLPRAKASDLAFLNAFIPEGAGISVLGGAGELRGNLELSTRSRHARGNLDIDGAVRLKNRDALLSGKATVRGVVRDLHLDTGKLDIGGSSIALDEVSVAAEGVQSKDFWLRVNAESCVLLPQAEVEWDAALKVGFKSLLPVMRIVSANVRVPWVVKAFSDLRDVYIQAGLSVRRSSVMLSGVHFQSGILAVDGDLRIDEVPPDRKPSKMLPYGALLVKVGALPVGIALNGESTTPVFIDAVKWFETKRRAQPQ